MSKCQRTPSPQRQSRLRDGLLTQLRLSPRRTRRRLSISARAQPADAHADSTAACGAGAVTGRRRDQRADRGDPTAPRRRRGDGQRRARAAALRHRAGGGAVVAGAARSHREEAERARGARTRHRRCGPRADGAAPGAKRERRRHASNATSQSRPCFRWHPSFSRHRLRPADARDSSRSKTPTQPPSLMPH